MTPDKEFNWIVAFTFVDSLNRIFYGMYSTFLGPSQPYLARKVGVDIDLHSLAEQATNIPTRFQVTDELGQNGGFLVTPFLGS